MQTADFKYVCVSHSLFTELLLISCLSNSVLNKHYLQNKCSSKSIELNKSREHRQISEIVKNCHKS